MSPEKHARLCALRDDPALQWAAALSHIARETNRHLDRLARSIQEVKAVDEAANFCRWLEFSGVCSLPHPDCQKLRGKVADILHKVGEIYKGGKVKPHCDASAVDALNAKMDYLLSRLPQAKLQTDAVVEVEEEPRATRLALPPAHLSTV